MASRALASGSEPLACEAASELLRSGGSALAAVLAGFFAAAGADPAVLLSPVTILVAGIGMAPRAFDGRARQPGLGAKRPRGFLPHERIPDAARIAIAPGVHAAMVAHAFSPTQTLSPVIKAGISAAARAGAPRRVALLERIRQVGSHALTETPFSHAVLRVAGPAQKGLLAPPDLAPPRQLEVPPLRRRCGAAWSLTPPWAESAAELRSESGAEFALGAIDRHATLAAVHYRRSRGLFVDELELILPFLAEPVRRGVSRVKPGTPLPSRAALELIVDDNGTPLELNAWLKPSTEDPHAVAAVTPRVSLRLLRDPRTGTVSELVAAS